MKLSIFVSVLLLFVFVCCKKSGPSSSVAVGTISATIDGVDETFNYSASALRKANDTFKVYSVGVVGYHDMAAGGTGLMLLGIGGTSPITTGSYTSSSSLKNTAYLNYYPTPDVIYVNNFNGTNPATFAITSLTATNIQGTFSGTLILYPGTTPAIKTVTNGKFNLNFQ